MFSVFQDSWGLIHQETQTQSFKVYLAGAKTLSSNVTMFLNVKLLKIANESTKALLSIFMFLSSFSIKLLPIIVKSNYCLYIHIYTVYNYHIAIHYLRTPTFVTNRGRIHDLRNQFSQQRVTNLLDHSSIQTSKKNLAFDDY